MSELWLYIYHFFNRQVSFPTVVAIHVGSLLSTPTTMKLLATLLSALRTVAEALKPSVLTENEESEAYDSVKQALGMVSGPLCKEISAFIFACMLN